MRENTDIIKLLRKVVVVQLIILLAVYCLAQFVPSQKEITREVEGYNLADPDYRYTEMLTTYIDAKGLVSFLETYHLRIIYWALCGDTIIHIGIIFAKKKEKRNFLHMHRELSEENYQNLEALYAKSAKVNHDIGNHLDTIYQLVDENSVEAAKSYIKEVRQPMETLAKMTWTGIESIDAILNRKLSIMEAKGITYGLNIEYPQNTNLVSMDICNILSNLLDNAIEATEKLPVEAREIYVLMRNVQHILFVRVTNSCEAAEYKKGGVPQTTKEDKKIHGWGLPSVVSTVEKYYGAFTCECHEGKFVAEAMLFYELEEVR